MDIFLCLFFCYILFLFWLFLFFARAWSRHKSELGAAQSSPQLTAAFQPTPGAVAVGGAQALRQVRVLLNERIADGIELVSVEWSATEPEAGVALRYYQRCTEASDEGVCHSELRRWPPTLAFL